MARKILALALVLFAVSGVTGLLLFGPGTVAVSIADQPPQPYDQSITAIYITFNRIDLHAANSGNDSGWHTIVTSATVDLLKNTNTSKFLGLAQLPAGKYTEIRFFADNATVTIDGQNMTYTIPSGSETGIKAVIEGGGFQLYGAQTMNVLLDVAFRNSEILHNPNGILVPVVTAKVTR